jgi:hypothetical protein
MPLRQTILSPRRQRQLSYPRRGSRHAWQTHVSGQGLGRRRLQQLGDKLQSNEAGNHDGSSFGGKLPANA